MGHIKWKKIGKAGDKWLSADRGKDGKVEGVLGGLNESWIGITLMTDMVNLRRYELLKKCSTRHRISSYMLMDIELTMKLAYTETDDSIMVA